MLLQLWCVRVVLMRRALQRRARWRSQERNNDIVFAADYAPSPNLVSFSGQLWTRRWTDRFIQHVHFSQWTPNLVICE